MTDLRDPFNDAVNYRSRQEKEFFSQIFLRTSDLFECLKPSIYYLIGEKGSGKTAYAAYLESNDVNGTRCKLSTMTESQYKRFIALKSQGKLEYSDYANIWRPMLLNMMAQMLVEKSKGFFESISGKFNSIEREISTFNGQALNPEVEVAFEMISEENGSIAIGSDKIGKLSIEDKKKVTDHTEQIKHHLLVKESQLKQALEDLKLSRNHILFVDGIDFRPEHVPYYDYLNCVKGIGEAVWQLNTEFFGNIRDSKGRMKVVLLVRPDVFNALNLYNSNSRLRDNSLLLDWSTTERELSESHLFKMTAKFFSRQQEFDANDRDAIDHYLAADGSHSIFKRLLRSSFQKPRDVLTFIKIARAISVRRLDRGNADHFSADIVRRPEFTREYSDYLLGEVRNYSAFYMGQDDFNLYIKFFQYLDGQGEFSYADFVKSFTKFKNWIRGERVRAVEYLRDAQALLQFFYDVNVIGYREALGEESENFVHFSYRERTLTNIAPKIKTAAVLMVNPGVSKALDIGLRLKPSTVSDAKLVAGRRRRHKPQEAKEHGQPNRRGQADFVGGGGQKTVAQKSPKRQGVSSAVKQSQTATTRRTRAKAPRNS
ncbi:P-loop ATPase, Sll1717 family [Burkholderia gladioli]|uniref:P-loop ATPase, Sll1717 family n=1 Tax=Burkholderia gladioli TaxID=28095 RepID=UPI00163F0FCF|nr:hypothetical protein [Burkholderia gladioli]